MRDFDPAGQIVQNAPCVPAQRAFCRSFNGIAHTPDSFDEPWLPAGFFHLLPEAGDVGHDGIVALHIFFLPNSLEELFGGDHFTPVLAEIP